MITTSKKIKITKLDLKKTFLQPTLCTIDSSPPGGADAGFIDACSAMSARWYANIFVILVWDVTLNIRPSYWSIGIICKGGQNLRPVHTMQEPEIKNSFHYNNASNTFSEKLIWFPHNIRAIMAKIKLPEKPCGMLLFWIQLTRTYRDLSSQADPAKENWTWSWPYFT